MLARFVSLGHPETIGTTRLSHQELEKANYTIERPLPRCIYVGYA
jgi:hypothetical protein